MKLQYSEGSAFLVPLGDGGYGRGVVARMAPRGSILMGYFFGPRLESKTDVRLGDLRPDKAVLRIRFGDLGLIDGHWPILEKLPNWDRAEWPMPDFVRRDPLGKRKSQLIRYSDVDPSKHVSETRIDYAVDLGTDSLAGYGFVEINLNRILS